MQFKYTKTDGREVEVNLPTSLSEVRLSAKLDFDAAYLDLIKYASTEMPEDFNHVHYVYLMAKAVSDFCTSNGLGTDLAAFFSLDAEGLVDSEGMLLPGVLQRHVEMFKDEEDHDSLDLVENSLDVIFQYIHKLLKSYDYQDSGLKDFTFQYKGETYTIPYLMKDIIYGTNTISGLTVGQLTEAYEVSRKLQKKYKEGEDNSSVIFTEILYTLAILSRKEGEVLPMVDTEMWIQKRAAHLQEIDYQTANDVFFLFKNIVESLSKRESCKYFFNPPKQNLDLANEQIRKQVEENKKVWERSGFKGILTRLLEMRVFEGQNGRFGMEAVWYADAVQGIEFLSLKNSGL